MVYLLLFLGYSPWMPLPSLEHRIRRFFHGDFTLGEMSWSPRCYNYRCFNSYSIGCYTLWWKSLGKCSQTQPLMTDRDLATGAQVNSRLGAKQIIVIVFKVTFFNGLLYSNRETKCWVFCRVICHIKLRRTPVSGEFLDRTQIVRHSNHHLYLLSNFPCPIVREL